MFQTAGHRHRSSAPDDRGSGLGRARGRGEAESAGPARLRLPAPITRPTTPPLPLAAAIGPLVAAGAIWALTHSAYALIFAALSPVMAIAGLVDALWQGRRSVRRQRAARRDELDRLVDRLAAARNRARDGLRARAPSAGELVGRPAGDPERWRGMGDRIAVTIGTGEALGDIEIDGEPQDDAERRLVAGASRVPDAPVLVPATEGIGIVGPPLLALSAMRGVLIQLVHALSPATTAVVHDLPGAEARALDRLPHAARRENAASVVVEVGAVRSRGAGEPVAVGRDASAGRDAAADPSEGAGAADADASPVRIRLVVAPSVDRIPPTVGTVLRVSAAGRAEVLHAPEGVIAGTVALEHVGRRRLEVFAAVLSGHADAVGALAAGSLPARVDIAALRAAEAREGPSSRPGLACAIGVGAQGVRVVDLVAAGPHAVIGGTTGSGKSEFLISWVTAMASGRTPAEVSFLLVDFKGGAAFTPLTALPHCVGVITDLDAVAAARAVSSLRAEIRRREALLAEAGASDVADAQVAGAVPRLVIVVDEFQAMLEALPDLHGVFADIAARGRSLGMHLVLCTQRPAGVVRDALMANCGLRVCLRVHARADSQAVIGDARAAALPADRPGRCLVGPVGAATVMQAAVTDRDGIALVAAESAAAPAARRPWLDPLPSDLSVEGIDAFARPGEPVIAAGSGAIPIGVADRPESQEQAPVRFDPRADGHLLALGAPRSGRSTLLRTVARGARAAGGRARPARGTAVVRSPEACWDTVSAAAAICSGQEAPVAEEEEEEECVSRETRLLLLDDLDALLARLDDDHGPALADALALVLREGRAHGILVVATAQRITGPLGALAPLFPERMLLRFPDRRELVLADGDPALFDPHLPPGGAIWRGERIQIARTAGETGDETGDEIGEEVDLVPLDPTALTGAVVVSRRPAAMVRNLRMRYGEAIEVVSLGASTGGPGGEAPAPAAGMEITGRGRPTLLVGDPEAWQQAWSLLAAHRDRLPMLFDACAPVDVRMLTRIRSLPPLVEPHRDRLWLATPEGELRRAVLA